MSATQGLKASFFSPPWPYPYRPRRHAVLPLEICFLITGSGGGAFVLLFPVKLSSAGAAVHATRFHKALGPDNSGERHFPLPACAFQGGQTIKEALSCVANLPSCKVFPALKSKTYILIHGCQPQLAPGSKRMLLVSLPRSLILNCFPCFFWKHTVLFQFLNTESGLDPWISYIQDGII